MANRALDDDNLVSAFKYLRDELSELILGCDRKYYLSKNGKVVPLKGRSDSDPRIQWHYKQEKSKLMGIRVEIESLPDPHTASIPHVDCRSGNEDSLKLTG